MRRSIFAAPLLAIIVAGCASGGGFAPITAQSVQQAAVNACKFLPTAATVTNLLTQNPNAQTAEAIAAIICGAVSPLGGRRLGTALTPSVVNPNGTITAIHGRWQN